MSLFHRKPSTAELEIARAREALLVVVGGFGARLDAAMQSIERLAGDVAATRRELRDIPRTFDVAATRAAMEFVGEANRATGVAQQQARLLADSDLLYALAGELVERGALEQLNTETERTRTDA